jgi:hypothetical protein
MLDEIGLKAALASLLERARAIRGTDVRGEFNLAYETGRNPTRLTPEDEGTVYRLVQEALTNIAKHAPAESSSVVVNEDGGVRVQLSDDGRGFEPAASSPGFGLVGMRERVELLAGTLLIESAPASGTTIHAEIPAHHRDAEARSRAKAEGAPSSKGKLDPLTDARAPRSVRMCALRLSGLWPAGLVQPQQCRLKPQQAHVAKDGVELHIGKSNLAAGPFKLDQPTDSDPAGRQRL